MFSGSMTSQSGSGELLASIRSRVMAVLLVGSKEMCRVMGSLVDKGGSVSIEQPRKRRTRRPRGANVEGTAAIVLGRTMPTRHVSTSWQRTSRELGGGGRCHKER